MDLLNTLSGAMGGGKSGSVIAALIPMIQKHGGLPGLMKMFQGAGLGNVVQSWISSGQNLPISPAQVAQVFGGASGMLGDVSKQAGVSTDEAASEISSALPSLVDKLSPGGAMPGGDFADMAKKALASGALGKLFG
jgi:uncharacterized protein YidB (DUF937 family)